MSVNVAVGDDVTDGRGTIEGLTAGGGAVDNTSPKVTVGDGVTPRIPVSDVGEDSVEGVITSPVSLGVGVGEKELSAD